MNIEEFEQERTILNQLMEERMNEPENDRYIIYDGVMKPDLYFNNKIRLAWMLKEPYDEEDGTGGGWNYFDMFPEGQNLYEVQFNRGHKTTWHPMIYIPTVFLTIFKNGKKWNTSGIKTKCVMLLDKWLLSILKNYLQKVLQIQTLNIYGNQLPKIRIF
jgi:hypothetical protein